MDKEKIIEKKIIEFIDSINDNELNIDKGKTYNDFIQMIKDNSRDENLYKYILNSNLIDKKKLNNICIQLECVIESFFSTSYFNGNKGFLEGRLSKCNNLMTNEGKNLEINENSKVLILGIGSMPITAILYSLIFNCEIIGIDIDNKSLNLANKIMHDINMNAKYKFIHSDAFNIDFNINDITHIVIAGHINNKNFLLQSLKEKINIHTKILVRKSMGLYKLIYSDININDINGYEVISEFNSDIRFPFSSIVLRRI